jgi:hypothetical protein
MPEESRSALSGPPRRVIQHWYCLPFFGATTTKPVEIDLLMAVFRSVKPRPNNLEVWAPRHDAYCVDF